MPSWRDLSVRANVYVGTILAQMSERDRNPPPVPSDAGEAREAPDRRAEQAVHPWMMVAVGETDGASLPGITPAERALLDGVFEAAFVGAQRATLLLLVVFAALTLVISAFLPRNSGNA
jgi:hypothetical protein